MFAIISIFYFKLVFITIISAEYLFPKHAIILSSEQTQKTYFGFAVQLQSASSFNGRVIVGAPKSIDNFHKYLVEPGAIYTCSLEAGNNCQQYEFNTGGATDDQYLKGKNYSCLGYSLDADKNIDGRFVACAPRWVDYKISKYAIPSLNGMCYHIKNGRDQINTQKLTPLNSTDLQFDGYEYSYILGEAGFSSHLIQDSETVVFTALGLHNWTGSAIQYNMPEDTYGKKYIVQPRNTAKFETYSYFGYSLSSGRFNSSDRTKIFYVSGAPRSDNLTGTVFIYEKLVNNEVFTKRYEFPGKQFGEYFGASVAVADINGDGIDDIIIGAPMHSTNEFDETGCIYTYITKKYDTSIKMQSKDKIVGDERGARFGTAISSIGDINKDGYEDIVVGAPYYQETGAIYLYLGAGNGLKFDQRILASDCNPNLRGFGFSLSRGVDIDNNQYNDLAVGAYLSGHVVILKSRPIVKVTPYLTSSIKQIDVNTKTFTLTKCLTYTTKDVPTDLNITTEIRVDRSQIIFENNINNFNYVYQKNHEHCEVIKMQIEEGLMHDTKITMSYKINNKDSDIEFCKLCPIEESHTLPNVVSIPFASGCSENICKPNLKISASFIDSNPPLIIGSRREIQIKVTVENLGENSFGTKLFLHINLAEFSVKPDFCKETISNLTCDFIKPLMSNHKRELQFFIKVENLPIHEKLLNVTLSVTSVSEDTDNSDNTVILELPLTTDVKYIITGKSEPEQLLMTENITSSVTFTHTYSVESIGATDLEILDVYFYIPYMYKESIIIDNIHINECNIRDNEEIVDANYEIVSNEVVDKITNLSCLSTQTENLKCKKIKCDVREGLKLTTKTIDVEFKVNISAFHEEVNSIYLITSLETNSDYFSVKSNARSSLIAVPKAASLTLYLIIGIIVGLILILIVALILYKVGFFKRHRPKKPEDEALLEIEDDAENAAKVDINETNNEDTKVTSISEGGTTFEKKEEAETSTKVDINTESKHVAKEDDITKHDG